MRKWNGKKRIGRKARAMRAGLRALPPGLYAFQISAVKMMESGMRMQLAFRDVGIQSRKLGKTLMLTHRLELRKQYGDSK